MLWVGNHDSRDTKGMALSCRWFEVLVRKAGDLDPPRVGQWGRIFASFWSTECIIASGVAMIHSTRFFEAKNPRIGPTPCGSSFPAVRTNTLNQRRGAHVTITCPGAVRADHEGGSTCLRVEILPYMEPVRARFTTLMVALAAEAHAMATRSGPK